MSHPCIRPSFCSPTPVLAASFLLWQGRQEGTPLMGWTRMASTVPTPVPVPEALLCTSPHQLTLGWPFQSLTFRSTPSREKSFSSTGEKHVRKALGSLAVIVQGATHNQPFIKRRGSRGTLGQGGRVGPTSHFTCCGHSPFFLSRQVFFRMGWGSRLAFQALSLLPLLAACQGLSYGKQDKGSDFMSVWTRISNSGLRKMARIVGIICLVQPGRLQTENGAGQAPWNRCRVWAKDQLLQRRVAVQIVMGKILQCNQDLSLENKEGYSQDPPTLVTLEQGA